MYLWNKKIGYWTQIISIWKSYKKNLIFKNISDFIFQEN